MLGMPMSGQSCSKNHAQNLVECWMHLLQRLSKYQCCKLSLKALGHLHTSGSLSSSLLGGIPKRCCAHTSESPSPLDESLRAATLHQHTGIA